LAYLFVPGNVFVNTAVLCCAALESAVHGMGVKL